MQERVAVLVIVLGGTLASPSSAPAAKSVRQPVDLSARASALYVKVIHSRATSEADHVRFRAAISKLTQAEGLLGTLRGRATAARLLTEAEGILENPAWRPPAPTSPRAVRGKRRAPMEDPLAKRESALYVRLIHDLTIDQETFRRANALRARASTLLGKWFGRGRAEAGELLDQAEALIGPP